jgi:glucosamine-6-phosphate deaminase
MDPEIVRVVKLDEICRRQQVHDGCFQLLDEVPAQALSLTIPSILSAKYLYCMVPGSTKAEAVRNSLYGEVGTACPATILRRHLRAVLFLDGDSVRLI